VTSIQLFDATGKLIETKQNFTNNQYILKWNSTNGILWLVVSTEQGIYIKEIVTIN